MAHSYPFGNPTDSNRPGAALVGMFALKDYFDLYLLGSIVWVTFAIASCFLLLVQWHMGRARTRIDHLQKVYFTEEQLGDIGLTDRERTNLDKQTQFRQSFRGGQFVAALITVLFVGSLLVFGALLQAAFWGEP
jgi:hypothetical protein